MAGTWPTARANIVTQLNDLDFDAGEAYVDETLTCLEYPPATLQTGIWPYCYVVPPAETVQWSSGKLRVSSFGGVRVHFALSPRSEGLEDAARRMEGLREAVKDALDDAVALDGNADLIRSYEIAELDIFDDHWGFDLTLTLRLSETKTLGA